VAFSPDGKIVAAGSDDHTVRLWEVATRQQIGTPLTGYTGPVTSVAFSKDGKTLAAGSYDHTVRLWDVTSRTVIATLTGHTGRVLSVAFSPDGKTLASGSVDGTVRLWDVATHQQIGNPLIELVFGSGKSLLGDWVQSVAFSPDSKTLATVDLFG
jgi:WD40 repeat protein